MTTTEDTTASERTPSHSVVAARPKGHSGKRLDIQGLRMLAVVSVVINHLTGWPLGGFTGVDVFFVISGFLITGRLLRTSTDGKIGAYFRSFYVLRARRILPAALVTLVLTVVAAHYAFLGPRAHSVSVDAFWSAIFFANWHFADAGTNYFNQGLPTSPLQHFWSLAVEEQFYVAWPVVVLIAAGIAVRLRRRVNISVAVVAVMITVLSFVFGWYETIHHPQTAYFSTFTRAWELGVGATLACLLPLFPPLRRWLTVTAGWIGVALITVGFVLTPGDHGFPVPWAAPAVIGSALIIASGGLGVPSKNRLLTNRLSVFLGDISYSIYLTHFPLVIIFGALITTTTGGYYTAVLAGTLGLSIASYYFVEEPVRTLRFTGHPHLNRRTVAAVACCAVALLAFALKPPLARPAFAQGLKNPPLAAPSPSAGASEASPLPHLQAALRESLQLTSWPTLSNQATVDRRTNTNYCSSPGTTKCTFQPTVKTTATRTVVLVGDSVMLQWLSMMKAAFLPRGWRVIQLARSDCFGADAPYADKLQDNGGALAQNTNCDKQHAFVRSVLPSLHPDLVLIENMSDAIYKVSDGQGKLLPHNQQITRYDAGLATVIEEARRAGATPVVLSATPNHLDWDACRIAGSTPLNCVHPPETRWYEIQRRDLAVTARLGAAYIDTLPLWCISGQCPDVVDNMGTVINNHHITQEYGEYVAPSLAAAFKKLRLL